MGTVIPQLGKSDLPAKIIVEHHVYFKNASTQDNNTELGLLEAGQLLQGNKFREAVIDDIPQYLTYCDQFDLPEHRYVLIESFFRMEEYAKNRVDWLKSKVLSMLDLYGYLVFSLKKAKNYLR